MVQSAGRRSSVTRDTNLDVESLETDSATVNGTTDTNALEADSATITNSGIRATIQETQIPNTTITQLSISSSDADADYSISSNEIIIPDDGRYSISVTIEFDSDTGWSDGDAIFSYPYVNENAIFTSKGRKIGTSPQTTFITSVTLTLVSGDSVSARAFQDSGSSKTAVKGNLSVVRLG